MFDWINVQFYNDYTTLLRPFAKALRYALHIAHVRLRIVYAVCLCAGERHWSARSAS